MSKLFDNIPGAHRMSPEESEAFNRPLREHAEKSMQAKRNRKRYVFDTGALMSSLREMVTADVHVQMIAANVLHASPDTTAKWQEQYSRHETVVREQLQALADEASRYKSPPRLGG